MWFAGLWKGFRGEEGYSLAEVLIIAAAVAVIASTVLAVLMPQLRALYQGAVQKTVDIMGSGF